MIAKLVAFVLLVSIVQCAEDMELKIMKFTQNDCDMNSITGALKMPWSLERPFMGTTFTCESGITLVANGNMIFKAKHGDCVPYKATDGNFTGYAKISWTGECGGKPEEEEEEDSFEEEDTDRPLVANEIKVRIDPFLNPNCVGDSPGPIFQIKMLGEVKNGSTITCRDSDNTLVGTGEFQFEAIQGACVGPFGGGFAKISWAGACGGQTDDQIGYVPTGANSNSMSGGHGNQNQPPRQYRQNNQPNTNSNPGRNIPNGPTPNGRTPNSRTPNGPTPNGPTPQDPNAEIKIKMDYFSDSACKTPKTDPFREMTQKLNQEKEGTTATCENGDTLKLTGAVTGQGKQGFCVKIDSETFGKVTWTKACGAGDVPGDVPGGKPGMPGGGAVTNSNPTDDGKKVKITQTPYKDKDCKDEMEIPKGPKPEGDETDEKDKSDGSITLGEKSGITCENGDTLVMPNGKIKYGECKAAGPGMFVKTTWTGACGGGMDSSLMWGLIGGGAAVVVLGAAGFLYCRSKQ